jgi:Asp-tRNA(Asn)/Glu-tRNA(Gln) amidotransferase A subunit family amidase
MPSTLLDALEARLAELEPAVQALLPEANRHARLQRELSAAEERRQAGDGGPLTGVLFGVKDVFRVAGLPTQAGSALPAELFAGPEAVAVTRLRAAGAVVLGKTVSTEFAYFAPGPTRNPRQLDHTPGGSSSGSAAAVAAGYCPFALGTQTIGSTIRPAAFCGIVGWKPSYDRIPRDGLIALAPSLDHVGILARDVATAGAVAAALTDNWQTSHPGAVVERPVLAIPVGPFLDPVTAVGRARFRADCHRLRAAGYEIREVDVMADHAAIVARHRRLLAAEAARVHAPWFTGHVALYHAKTRELVWSGRDASNDEVASLRAGCLALRAELTAAMDTAGVDLWVTPAALGPAPRGLDSTGDPAMCLPWTQAGLPSLGLPTGTDPHGLPLGLQVVARFGADEALLAWGRELEALLG